MRATNHSWSCGIFISIHYDAFCKLLKPQDADRQWLSSLWLNTARGGRREAERGGPEGVESSRFFLRRSHCELPTTATHLRSFKLERFSLGASIPCFAAGGPASQNARVSLLPDTKMAKELRYPGRRGLHVP